MMATGKPKGRPRLYMCPQCGRTFKRHKQEEGANRVTCSYRCGWNGQCVKITMGMSVRFPNRVNASTVWMINMWRQDKALDKNMIIAIRGNYKTINQKAEIVFRKEMDGRVDEYPMLTEGAPLVVKYTFGEAECSGTP